MKLLIDKIVIFILNVSIAAFQGFIPGLMTSMAVFTMRHKPVWTLGFTIFFALFHAGDLKDFYRERNWIGLIGRSAVLFAITAGIVSLFVFAFGGIEAADEFDVFATLAIIGGSIPVALGWLALKTYGSGTSLYRELRGIVDGLQSAGVLWKT